MAKNVRVKMRSRASRALLRSADTEAMVKGRADSMAAEAGSGYIANFEVGPNRARSYVFTRTHEAMKDNARNNTLLRIVGSRSR